MNQSGDPSIPLLKKLENSFKWEARILYIVALSTILYLIHPLLGLVVGAVEVLLIIIMDATFSVLVTLIFLRPINEALKSGKGVAQHSQGVPAHAEEKVAHFNRLNARRRVVDDVVHQHNTFVYGSRAVLESPLVECLRVWNER